MKVRAWLGERPKRWAHLRQIPLRRLWVLLLAVFLLFSVIGFYVDLMAGGVLPYAVVLINAALSGVDRRKANSSLRGNMGLVKRCLNPPREEPVQRVGEELQPSQEHHVDHG